MKSIVILISLLFSLSSFAENFSMRSCMLLPITDTAGNSFGYKVFEKLEEDIKEQGWCDYKPSSEVIGIFSKYRERLPEYLKDKNVLKTVAERLGVGTIIRVSLEYEVDQVQVSMDIVGENGSDIYMSEKNLLSNVDTELVVSTIRNWLELYESTIPYGGKVMGVLGDQITFSIAPSKQLVLGQKISIKRFIKKKKHPLLKKIVEWDSVPLARAKIFKVSEGQGLATVKIYNSNKKLKTGDWVRFEKPALNSQFSEEKFKEYKNDSFGRLGELSVALSLASQRVSTSVGSGNVVGSGPLFGFHAEAEAWITRNYFVVGEFSRNLGNLSVESSQASQNSTGQNSGTIKIGGGYKYLPLGFFYGPQVNAYAGWASYSYDLDRSPNDGFGTNSISGIFLGVGGSIPLKRQFRVLGNIEILPFGEFSDESNIFGSQKSISSLNLKIALHYRYTSSIKLLAMVNALNNSARTSGANSSITYRDTSLKLGGVFSF